MTQKLRQSLSEFPRDLAGAAAARKNYNSITTWLDS